MSEIDKAIARQAAEATRAESSARRAAWLADNFGPATEVRGLNPIPPEIADLVDQFIEMSGMLRREPNAWLARYHDGSLWAVETRALHTAEEFRAPLHPLIREDHLNRLRAENRRRAEQNVRIRKSCIRARTHRMYFGGDFESLGLPFDIWVIEGDYFCSSVHIDRASFAEQAARHIPGSAVTETGPARRWAEAQRRAEEEALRPEMPPPSAPPRSPGFWGRLFGA